MNTSFTIRKYIPRDKTAVVKLMQMNTPQYFHPEEEEDFKNYLEQKIEDYFIIESNAQIIGCGGINYFFKDAKARISWDMISPDFHTKGAGRQLLQYRIDYAKANSSIEKLEVRTTQHVYKFYEKMGFVIEKVEKDFWAESFDLYQMKLNLKEH